MVKRKNLQCYNDLEPSPKKQKYIITNFYKKQIILNKKISNINVLTLSKSINQIDNDDKINKICNNINNINFKDKLIKSEESYIYDYYFL